MGQFREYLAESENKVYYVRNELWVAHGQGSGITSQVQPDGFITNKEGDKNYDSLVDKLVKFANVTKPLKEKADSKLYEINMYDNAPMGQAFDVWGGDIKPKGTLYMIVHSGSIAVVNLFKSKNEALNWINSL